MNTRIMMKIVAAFSLAVNVGSAAAVNFPSVGGNLADPVAWGGTLPASTADVTFTQGGTYTASNNVSFRTVMADALYSETKFDFTANNAKLTLTGGSGVDGFAFSEANLQRVILNGGVWDFNGAKLRNGRSSSNGAIHLNMRLEGGVVVTNVSDFYWAKHAQADAGHYNSCTIQGGAKVYTTGDLLNYATGWDAQLNISGGAKVVIGGSLYTDKDGNAAPAHGRNKITVTGAGTLLEIKGTSSNNYIGHTHHGNIVTIGDNARFVATAAPTWIGAVATAITNSLVITGGASANMGTTYVGRSDGTWGNRYVVQNGAHATNNYLCVGGENSSDERTITKNELVVDNAELYVHNWTAIGKPGQNNRATIKSGGVFSTGSLTMGDSAYSVSNRFEALAGSSATVRGNVAVGTGGNWNELVVSNAALFTANNIQLGGLGTHHNTVRIYGPNTDFAGISGNWDIFNNCYDCLAELRDGATLDTHSAHLRIGKASTNCTLRIAGGSHLYVTNTSISIYGTTSSIGLGNSASISNRMELLDESYAKVNRWRMTSEDGCTVLSNSTFEATNGDGFQIGYKDVGQTSVVAGNRFELHGDYPKVKTVGQFSLSNRSTLHLQVPVDGYEKNYALIESGTFKLDDADSRITVDMDEYVAKRGGRIIVAQTTGGLTLNAAALSASNALLPDRCSFAASADGKTLYLKVPSKSGMLIFYR